MVKCQIKHAFLFAVTVVSLAAAATDGYHTYITTTKGSEAVWNHAIVDTGVVPSPTTRFIIDFRILDFTRSGDNYAEFGTEYDGSTTSPHFTFGVFSDGHFKSRITSAEGTSGTAEYDSQYTDWGVHDDGRHTIELASGSTTFDGKTVACQELSATQKTAFRTFYLFGKRYGYDEYEGRMSVYGCKIYDGETLIRDFRPYETNGVAGLLDEVSGVLYTNVSYRSKKAANKLKACDSKILKRKLLYVEADASDWQSSSSRDVPSGAMMYPGLDVGDCLTAKTKFKMDFRRLHDVRPYGTFYNDKGDECTSAGYERMGYSDQDGTAHYIEFTQSDIRVVMGDSSTSPTTTSFGVAPDCKRHTIVWGTGTCSYDNKEIEAAGFSASKKCNSAHAGAIFAYANSAWCHKPFYSCSLRVYRYQVYQDGHLCRDLVPAEATDGTIGLYDKITTEFATRASYDYYGDLGWRPIPQGFAVFLK